MRERPTKRIEHCRVTEGPFASTAELGPYGMFFIPGPDNRALLKVMVSAGSDEPGMDWEHVSVSLQARCPTWDEMDFIKRIFWKDDETVMQLHVPRSEHVNFHEFCLHLWRPINHTIPLPDPIMVGPKRS